MTIIKHSQSEYVGTVTKEDLLATNAELAEEEEEDLEEERVDIDSKTPRKD